MVVPGTLTVAGVGDFVLFRMAAFCNVELLAADRVNAVGMADVLEVQHAEHVAVVGQREGLHVQLFGAGNQGIQLARSVQERIVRVYVQVHELAFRRSFRRVGENVDVCHGGLLTLR